MPHHRCCCGAFEAVFCFPLTVWFTRYFQAGGPSPHPGPGSHPVILRANSPATPGTIQDTLPPALPVQRIPNPHVCKYKLYTKYQIWFLSTPTVYLNISCRSFYHDFILKESKVKLNCYHRYMWFRFKFLFLFLLFCFTPLSSARFKNLKILDYCEYQSS